MRLLSTVDENVGNNVQHQGGENKQDCHTELNKAVCDGSCAVDHVNAENGVHTDVPAARAARYFQSGWSGNVFDYVRSADGQSNGARVNVEASLCEGCCCAHEVCEAEVLVNDSAVDVDALRVSDGPIAAVPEVEALVIEDAFVDVMVLDMRVDDGDVDAESLADDLSSSADDVAVDADLDVSEDVPEVIAPEDVGDLGIVSPAVDAGDDVVVGDRGDALPEADRQSVDLRLSMNDMRGYFSQAQRSMGEDNGGLSVGVSAGSYFSPQMYIDIMKQSLWRGGDADQRWGEPDLDLLQEQGIVDENGWFKSVDGLNFEPHMIFEPQAAPSGRYELRYEGEGEIWLHPAAVSNVERADGKITFDLNEGSALRLAVMETDPNKTGDYIRDISIVRAEHVELHEAGALFNPDYVDVVKDFKELRFMNANHTNETDIRDWDERTMLGDYSYSDDHGMPIEVMVRLANETGTDMWVNMPHTASDDYIEQFAIYVRDNLDPNLKVTVEYSNEIWNDAFQSTRDIRAGAVKDWGVAKDDWEAQFDYGVKEAVEAAVIWENVFGADGADRLVKTFATFPANAYYTSQRLEAEQWKMYDPDGYIAPGDVFDSLAVTSYFGTSLMSEPKLRDGFVHAIRDPKIDEFEWLKDLMLDPDVAQSLPNIEAQFREHKDIADRYGLELTQYEGGTHLLHSFAIHVPQDVESLLTQSLIEFADSEQMAELYREAFGIWDQMDTGNPFMQFHAVGEHTRFGTWSFQEDFEDSSSWANVIYDYNANSQSVDEGDASVHRQQGVTDVRDGDADDVLIGSRQEDYLIGGAGDDVFVTGLGVDAVHGGAGIDILLLKGGYADYDVSIDEGYGRSLVIEADQSVDRAMGVEFFAFEDGRVFTFDGMISGEAVPLSSVAADDAIVVADVTSDEIVINAEVEDLDSPDAAIYEANEVLEGALEALDGSGGADEGVDGIPGDDIPLDMGDVVIDPSTLDFAIGEFVINMSLDNAISMPGPESGLSFDVSSIPIDVSSLEGIDFDIDFSDMNWF